MDRKTFGKLVRVLRKEQDWTQHVLADLANLSCRTIEKIESGELKKLDYNILSRLADALELTTAERKKFFFAAIEIDNNEPIDAHGNRLVVRDHLISITRSVNIPAFVHDHFGDIIAANTAIITLLNVSQAMIDDYAHMPAGCNVMRLIFDPSLGYQRLVGEWQWSSSARSNI
ncbi:helix-turn-helix domain-containing protein [Chloroflexus sp.]|uniref:helix-turn-helix domain-containing protein n=1 Tax=Chloroflexus sp. TaxID=1904827 RepID=UPI004049920F